MVWQAPDGQSTIQKATHDLSEARARANTGALVIEYGKVGLVRAGGA